jgi:hypothetical protein
LKKAQEERRSQDPTVELAGGQSKAETIETLEIFQVWEESQISGGGAIATIGSSRGKDLDRWNPRLDNEK